MGGDAAQAGLPMGNRRPIAGIGVVGLQSQRLLKRRNGFVEFPGVVPVGAFQCQQAEGFGQRILFQFLNQPVGFFMLVQRDFGEGLLFLVAAFEQQLGFFQQFGREFSLGRIFAELLGSQGFFQLCLNAGEAFGGGLAAYFHGVLGLPMA